MADVALDRRHEDVRRRQRRRRSRPPYRRWRVRRAARADRRRQDDDAAPGRRAGAAGRRHDPYRRPRRDALSSRPARDVAFVFQQYSLYPHLSVYDNLAFPLRSPARRDAGGRDPPPRRGRGEDGAHPPQARTTARRSFRAARCSASPSAARWCASPPIYLMDEPLSSLDAKLRADLRLELKRIQSELGATMLYVTHDQIEAMTMADRIGILADGVLVQIGTPSDDLHRAGKSACRGAARPAGDQSSCRPGCCRMAVARAARRRSARAPSICRSRRPRTATPTASSTGSSISATRTICM